MKILLTGATGLVGQRLGQALVRSGHHVVAVTRSRERALEQLSFPCDVIEADLTQDQIAPEKLGGIEAVVHLMGESVAGARWSPSQKEKILSSRVASTLNLQKSFSALAGAQLPVWVQASAVGIYGDSSNDEFDESSPIQELPAEHGVGFLQNVCREWEKGLIEGPAASMIQRSVLLRIGVVVSENEGALEQMRPLFRKGLGAALGKGDQWMSWIHLTDLVAMIQWSLENKNVSGVYNAVSPDPVSNQDFSKALAQTLGVGLGPHVPALALKVVVGEMAAMLLASQKVLPRKAQAEGFHFQFQNLQLALSDVNRDQQEGESVFIAEQYLPKPPAEVFPFFAEAKNLEEITPEQLNFHILEMSTPEIQEGTLIHYKLKIRGVPVGWTTRIENWKPPTMFSDTQLKGPYQLWHHTHEFIAMGEGTLMRDRVIYRLPLGGLGDLVAGSFVRGDVEKIFAHRRKVCAKKFR